MNMLRRKVLITGILFTLVSIGLVSCKYYLQKDFRTNYTEVNEVLHTEDENITFFKVHLKNGEVCLLHDWWLSENKDSLIGAGSIFDFNRSQLKKGKIAKSIDEISIIETNDLSKIKDKDNERIAALSILTAINVAITTVCIANPKACYGSCPTFMQKVLLT